MKPYQKPTVTSYSALELLAMIGPAAALYGTVYTFDRPSTSANR